MSRPQEPGPDRPASTRDDSPHGDPETKRDVDRGRETAKEVIEDPEVVDDEEDDEEDDPEERAPRGAGG